MRWFLTEHGETICENCCNDYEHPIKLTIATVDYGYRCPSVGCGVFEDGSTGRMPEQHARLLERIVIAQLAAEFSKTIRQWLTPEMMTAAIRRNRENIDGDGCATHDFCDANMAMDEAWGKVVGVELDANNEWMTRLWNEAWTKARLAEFRDEPKPASDADPEIYKDIRRYVDDNTTNFKTHIKCHEDLRDKIACFSMDHCDDAVCRLVEVWALRGDDDAIGMIRDSESGVHPSRLAFYVGMRDNWFEDGRCTWDGE